MFGSGMASSTPRTPEGDPVTLPVIAASLVAIPLSRYRRDYAPHRHALFGAYVLRTGGD
jgi:hypothetical protein